MWEQGDRPKSPVPCFSLDRHLHECYRFKLESIKEVVTVSILYDATFILLPVPLISVHWNSTSVL